MVKNTPQAPAPLRHMDITGLILVAGMLLIGFFFVAGLEIAYTDLRDKDPGQVSSNVRALLKDMQTHEAILYEAREWLGVILIVIFAYISDFESIFIPWLGERHWRLRFTLLFTTVPLTWLAQGPAKRLAAQNSEQFLGFARPMWAVFKAIGILADALELRSVTTMMAWLLRRINSFISGREMSENRNLPPSNSAYYVSSLRRYGYALHKIEDIAVILMDGSISVTQKGIIHVVAGGRSHFTRGFTFESNIRSHQIRIVKACRFPRSDERVDEICRMVDAWQGGLACEGAESFDCALLKARGVVDAATPQRITFEISSAVDLPDGASGNREFAMEYELTVTSDPGSFKTAAGQPESYARSFTFPCRNYALSLSMDAAAPVGFGSAKTQVTFQENRHPMEEQRIQQHIVVDKGKLSVEMPYPLPGALYNVSWEVW